MDQNSILTVDTLRQASMTAAILEPPPYLTTSVPPVAATRSNITATPTNATASELDQYVLFTLVIAWYQLIKNTKH